MERGRGKSIVTPGEEANPDEESSDDVPESGEGGSKEQPEESEGDGRTGS